MHDVASRFEAQRTPMVGGEEVVIMVDPAAAHNFISLATVAHLPFPVSPTRGFGVSFGNGEAIHGTGECRIVVVVEVHGIRICENFLPLALGSSDIILGVQWLEQLGTTLTNWKQQTVKFKVQQDLGGCLSKP